MRKFFCFKIKDEYYELTKNNPKELYNVINDLYHSKDYEINYSISFFKEIRIPFNKSLLNSNIYNSYCDKYNYRKINDTHMFNDYYTKEDTSLTVYNNYLVIKTNTNFPEFLKSLSKKENIFVIDFKYKDYFWLSSYK